MILPTAPVSADPTTGIPLPLSDEELTGHVVELEALARRWRDQAALPTMTGEEMRGGATIGHNASGPQVTG